MADDAMLEAWLRQHAGYVRQFWADFHHDGNDEDVQIVTLMFVEPGPGGLIRRFAMLPESASNTDHVDELIVLAHDDVLRRTLSGETLHVFEERALEEDHDGNTGMD